MLTRGKRRERAREAVFWAQRDATAPLRRRDGEGAAVVMNAAHKNTWPSSLERSHYIRSIGEASRTRDKTTPFSTMDFQFQSASGGHKQVMCTRS